MLHILAGVEKLKGIVKPRSAHLYVVEPAKIRFSIIGNNWYLQKNAIYKITIQLLDSADNVIYIPEVYFRYLCWYSGFAMLILMELTLVTA